MTQKVILVDEYDQALGTEEKLKAHQAGLLHRAFSAFVVNDKNELMLQKRAGSKYHSAGLWTNTCCSHPAPGEALKASAEKRLFEEMGFSCSLNWLFKFKYRASLENNLIEHEIDHVFLGRFNASPAPNPAEVADWRWVDLQVLKEELKMNPNQYSFWLCHIYDRFYEHYQSS